MTYRRSGALYVASASRGGRFGRPRRVPGGRVGVRPHGTRVAVDGRGDALIAWTANDESIDYGPESRDEPCCDRVHAVIRRRSGRLTRVRTLSRPGHAAQLVAVDAGGGRFGVLWDDARGRLAVGGRAGRFGLRRNVPGGVGTVALALTGRRILVHRRYGAPEDRRAYIAAVRFSGRRPGRPRVRAVVRNRAIEYVHRFAATIRNDILGLFIDYGPRARESVVSHGRSTRRRVFGKYNRVALAGSGRGVVAGARGRAVVVRLRRPGGALSGPRRHAAVRNARVRGAAINSAGDYAVVYRGRRRLGVLAGGRRRTVSRLGDRFAFKPVSVDARGRTRVLYVRSGRVRSWRSGG